MSLGLGFLLLLGKFGLNKWFSDVLAAVGPFCQTESYTDLISRTQGVPGHLQVMLMWEGGWV